MPICPNCAIPVRDSARFCTSCGSRLDGATMAYVPPPPPPPVPDWEPQPPAPDWPAPPSPNTWPGQEPQWPPTAESWPSPGWQPAPSDLPFDPVAHAAIHGVAEDDRWRVEEETVAVEIHAEAADSPWPSASLGPDSEFGGEIVDESFAVAGSVAASESVAPPPAATWIPAGSTDAAAARERAAELLTELRDLLPRLSNPSGADPVALAAVLESGIAADRMRWSDLRTVMEAARDRPRDVETVLALSQQVDAVIALLDRHERLIEAVQRAARQLRGAD